MSNERKVGVKAYLPLQLDLLMIAIDFIEASAILVKDKPFLGNLEWCSAYNNGTEKYWLKGCRNVEILWNESSCTLILRGSIMYYMQGHNFTFDKPTFVQGINLIGNLLHLDLWNIGMIVNIFESGAIVEADKPPKDIIGHTREGKGMWIDENPKDKQRGTCRSYNDSNVYRKFYDAGRNIQHKQGTSMKQVIEKCGWNPEGYYLKFEAKYLKPQNIFNSGVGLTLSDLVNPQREAQFQTDLYSQYKKLIPMKTLVWPTEKADLSTTDFFAMELVENLLNEGKTIEEARKIVYARINASAGLSPTDKDARKRNVKKVFDKMQLSEESEWDISKELHKVIFDEEEGAGTDESKEDESSEEEGAEK